VIAIVAALGSGRSSRPVIRARWDRPFPFHGSKYKDTIPFVVAAEVVAADRVIANFVVFGTFFISDAAWAIWEREWPKRGLTGDWYLLVRSSIARRLGMDIGALTPSDRDVEGIVEMMLDATQHHDEPLTEERPFGWHAALFPTGRSGMHRIKVGTWRDDSTGPMQVVSGPVGKEKVHFEAPEAGRIGREMAAFLEWFNRPAGIDPVLKAALAHLWFVTIHPFDDGNGRIARAIADLALARSERSPKRFYSMSAQIRLERGDYYALLERTQKGTLDVTPWMEWFLGCLDRAFDGAEAILANVLRKARFWGAHPGESLNERQRKVLNRLLDGFEGKLTSSKWALIEKCSPDTALRDIADLVQQGLLRKNEGGGRSTNYSLADAQS
jgi:Fic family protein